jgi:hypothetical protein
LTNKTTAAGKVVRFHQGRGYQEKIYGELKNQARPQGKLTLTLNANPTVQNALLRLLQA